MSNGERKRQEERDRERYRAHWGDSRCPFCGEPKSYRARTCHACYVAMMTGRPHRCESKGYRADASLRRCLAAEHYLVHVEGGESHEDCSFCLDKAELVEERAHDRAWLEARRRATGNGSAKVERNHSLVAERAAGTTLAALAVKYGISPERVRQIDNQARRRAKERRARLRERHDG